MNESKSQATLGCSQTGSITVSKSFLQEQINLQQLITKAEIIQALHVVENNQSFRSTDKDSERYREQFPDFKTAAGYLMHGDETRHIILYGIASFAKDFIIHDTKGKCFTYTDLLKRSHPIPRSNTAGISLTLVIFLSSLLEHIVDLCLSDTVLPKSFYNISTLSWTRWIYQPTGFSILAWVV